MNESVLNALMQLFAIVADVDGLNDKSRETVRSFLENELNAALAEKYLLIYDDFIQTHHFRKAKKDGKVKRTSRNAVKILRIASEINQTLTRQQKLIVLIRLVEYIHYQHGENEQNQEFLTAIAEGFNTDSQEFNHIQRLIAKTETIKSEEEQFVVLNSQNKSSNDGGGLTFLNLETSKVLVFKLTEVQELYAAGAPIIPEKVYVFGPGTSIRGRAAGTVYYSDILAHFTHKTVQVPVVFNAHNIEYWFNKKEQGLHQLNFKASSGQMLGIMGGSGTGKSTLLNVLNGNYTPTQGSVKINQLDIHRQKSETAGLIGYVPQDDLLIEELTVYENLFYNAKLCFGKMPHEEINFKVEAMLKALGLEETRDLKVGSTLEKTISGGQRKRINIALELMREPAVLFVDEPTSGLSSRDSVNIMDLLKELALKGKLVFVVIHQPSSEIFKMFDSLLILDKGGYLIYKGNPLDGIAYFRTANNQNLDDSASCGTCGNVNPEQIFDIIDAKYVNEYGDATDQRKRSPKDWSEIFKKSEISAPENFNELTEKPVVDFAIPSVFTQFGVFFKRDILSKIKNQQYLIINLFEAPVLALIIAGFLRYKPGEEYLFRDNENVLAYLFISVVVALFLGLSVSAEEIIRDQKIRKRESFLNLSKGGYLLAKIGIQFIISAIQIFLYVSVGNLVLGIHGMTLNYWLILFSAACFANILGLNISASFKNVVTIYILIPFIIIPQILFSGVLVKYHELNPIFASKREVPWVGNIMASRWAFEALAVEQTINNSYEKYFYNINRKLYHFSFMKNYWVPEINGAVSSVYSSYRKGLNDAHRANIKAQTYLILKEFEDLPAQELEYFKGNWQNLKNGEMTLEDADAVKDFLRVIGPYYARMVGEYTAEKDKVTTALKKSLGSDSLLLAYKNAHENQQLWEFVNNKNSLKKIVEHQGELLRNENHVYQYPIEGIHHYFTPVKHVGSKTFSTFWYNIMMMWAFSIFLAFTLYFDVLKKLISWLSKIK